MKHNNDSHRRMTVDEAVAKTEASLDKQIAEALERDEVLIVDHGGTDVEVSAFLAHRKDEFDAWKAETLSEIRRGLSDFDAPSVKLQ